MSRIFFLLFAFPLSLFSQNDENWEVYMAQYEKGAGSTVVNMGAKQFAGDKGLPFVVITGVTFKDCTPEGMPTKTAFDELYTISDSVSAIVTKTVTAMAVGTFTYQCERLDYFYVSDTAHLRAKLNSLYKSHFPGYTPYINIKVDNSWEGYLSFLYPNEETLGIIGNQKVVMQLHQAGDDASKPRQIDHWLYFKTKEHVDCIRPYLTQNKFRITSQEKSGMDEYPISLLVSRNDNVELETINPITLGLRKAAAKCKGKYDGWECPVTK